MSLITGYSSDSENALEDESNEPENNFVVPLPKISPAESIQSVSGKFQQEIIDHFQFKRNKRLLNELNDNSILVNESKKTKFFESIKATKAKAKALRKSKSNSKGDVSQLDDENDAYKGSWGSDSASEVLTDFEGDHDKDDLILLNNSEQFKDNTTEFKETSKFYGNKSHDYSIFDLPKDYQIRFATTIVGQKEYFVPKKKLSSFKAHDSAVASLEFFPNSGHMMLSSGNDGMIKLWSTTRPKSLIRDYRSHNRTVKHSTFSSNGEQFVSCSYDKNVKIWNTELGEVEFRHKLKSNPNMCTFVPNAQNEIMVALHSNKVVHLDSRSGDIIQVYEHHDAPVTWIEFINDGNQFITASDDRTLKIWDLRINMPIKYIQDPKQQAMPIVKKHPNGRYFVGQSMDNKVLVYSTKPSEKFKKVNTKFFTGHNCAAYAIQMGFTPDGKTLFSGDSTGYCYFWDWKTSRIIKKIKVSDEVISCVDIHPLESSLYAMAGYDGNIYMYS